MSKISKWWILGGSIFISLVVGLILYFALVKPRSEKIADLDTQAAGIEQGGGTALMVSQHQQLLKQTQKHAQQDSSMWQVNEARYMPTLPYGKGDKSSDILQIYAFRDIKGYHGLKDLPEAWGKWITKWYESQHKDGVDLYPDSVFAIPSLSTDPNAISQIQNSLPLPEAGKPWTVTLLCKSFQDAMLHLRRINELSGHGMPVIDNVSLQGQSPQLILSYTLMLYVIPGTTPPPPDPRLGEGLGNSSSSGGMGMGMGMKGMGGAMGMGMSPMGMGGPPAAAGGPRGISSGHGKGMNTDGGS